MQFLTNANKHQRLVVLNHTRNDETFSDKVMIFRNFITRNRHEQENYIAHPDIKSEFVPIAVGSSPV
jgi:hypothetical protein